MSSKGIAVFVSTNIVGSKSSVFYSWESLGITEHEFDAMKPEEQNSFVWELANSVIDWGYRKVEKLRSV